MKRECASGFMCIRNRGSALRFGFHDGFDPFRDHAFSFIHEGIKGFVIQVTDVFEYRGGDERENQQAHEVHHKRKERLGRNFSVLHCRLKLLDKYGLEQQFLDVEVF